MKTMHRMNGCVISRDNIWLWLLSNDLISIEWKSQLLNLRSKINSAWKVTPDIGAIATYREKLICQDDTNRILRLAEERLGPSCKNFLGCYVDDFMKHWSHITTLWPIRNLFICQEIIDLCEILDTSIPTLNYELNQNGLQDSDCRWKLEQADKQLKLHQKRLESIYQNFGLMKEAFCEGEGDDALLLAISNYLHSFEMTVSRKIYDLLNIDFLRQVIPHPDLLHLLPQLFSVSEAESIESIRCFIQDTTRRLDLIQECHTLLSFCAVRLHQCGEGSAPIPSSIEMNQSIDSATGVLDLINSYVEKVTVFPDLFTSISVVGIHLENSPHVIRLYSVVKTLLHFQQRFESLIASYNDKIAELSAQKQVLKGRLEFDKQLAREKKSVIMSFIEMNTKGKSFVLEGFDHED